MSASIIIIGGLAENPDRETLLRALRERTGNEVKWEWIKADASRNFEPPKKYLNALIGQLSRLKGSDRPCVVTLNQLHGRSKNQIYKVYSDPVLVPPEIYTSEALVEWLVSPTANLIPRRDWFANTQEAAIIAILCKLIRNKSWNKDTQGHAWTKEEDLLGQAPVNRREHQEILIEATRLLPSLQGTLLLTKGSTGGKTPKEWCIKLTHVKAVKTAIIDCSLQPLTQVEELAGLIDKITANDNRKHRLDQNVATERIRQICRDRH